MSILFTRFPLESAFGGAEVQTLSLMKGLTERGHEVSFLGSCPTLLQAISDQRLAVSTKQLEIGPPPVTKWGAISFLWRKFGMKKKLIEKLNAECSELNAIFMLSLSEKILLTPWCIENGIKVFWIEHDRIGPWLTKNPLLPNLKRLSRHVKTIGVSELSRDLYIKLGWNPDDVIAIPNGIDTNKFASVSRKSRSPDSPLHLGCIARFTHDKGVDVLLEAIKDMPDIELTIVGTGPEEEKLKEQASRLSLAAYRFTTPTNNIQQFYSEIDALVLPSRDHDPFGLVVAEAMAAGIPTICTDACGIALHLDATESIIVKAGDSTALRNTIESLKDESLYKKLADNGPRLAQEKFSIGRMVEAYDQLLY